MHPRAETFAHSCRERYDLDVTVREFPEGTKTAADAADAIGCETARIASSLAFDVDGDLVVAVASGATRVDEDALAAVFDADAATMADPDRISEVLGWSIGGVPPFCHATSVPVVVDERLLDFETVWAAAGTPTAVFEVAPDRVRSLADATVVDVAR